MAFVDNGTGNKIISKLVYDFTAKIVYLDVYICKHPRQYATTLLTLCDEKFYHVS